MATLLAILLILTALFLIVLIILQRGRGGGLAGALGGMGGQSAFGTKAGDLFTRITIGVAIFWILLCVASYKVMGLPGGRLGTAAPASSGVKAESEEVPASPSPDAEKSDTSAALTGEAAPEGAPPAEPSPSSEPAAGESK